MFFRVFPADSALFETRLHGVLESTNNLAIKITTAIFDDAASASACFSSLLDKIDVASGPQAECEYSDPLVVCAGSLVDLIWLSDLTISQDEHSLFIRRSFYRPVGDIL